jgi:hypothetical protein
MTIAAIINLARKNAGECIEAQRDWLAHLCIALSEQISPGYMRAHPKTGPSDEEIRKRSVASVLLTTEEIEKGA